MTAAVWDGPVGHAIPAPDAPPATDRAAWLHNRRHGLGGSDVAAICGLSPWRGPYEVWSEKTGRTQPDMTERRLRLTIGTRFEPTVRDLWAETAGHTVATVGQTLAHPDHPWCRANIDGVTLDEQTGTPNAVVEVKTVERFVRGEWFDDGQLVIPVHYELQALHYSLVTGLPTVRFAVLVGLSELLDPADAWLTFQPEQLENLAEFEETWWTRHVVGDTPPPWTAADRNTIARLIPDPGSTIELDDDATDLLDTYRQWQLIGKQAADKKTLLADELRALIGEHEAATITGRIVATNKTTTRAADATTVIASSTANSPLLAGHPDLDLPPATTTHRRLHIPTPKDKP